MTTPRMTGLKATRMTTKRSSLSAKKKARQPTSLKTNRSTTKRSNQLT
jgi:hypothetical protein